MLFCSNQQATDNGAGWSLIPARANQTKMLTPLQQDWTDLKAQAPGFLIGVRLGDFVEFFNEDAAVVAKALKIVVTKRNNVPMAGVPYHAWDKYVGELTAAGHNVALADVIKSGKRVLTEIFKANATSLPWQT